MIVQEDVPYTKEEVKAMVNTIHDLREKVSQLGWHPASELPIVPKDEDSVWVYCLVYGKGTDGTVLVPMCVEFTMLGWRLNENIIVKWWCYPPEEE